MSEPLHLTEENKEAIRAFVREHIPHLLDEMRVDRERALEKLRAEKERLKLEEFKRALQGQWANQPLVQPLSPNVYSGGNPFLSTSATLTTATTSPGNISYAPIGTGFTVYDSHDAMAQAVAGLAGLTLKK